MRPREEERYRLALIVALVIGAFLTIILALVGPDIVQMLLFKHGDTFFILTPFKANIYIGVSGLLFCIACLLLLFEKRLLIILGIVLFIPFLFLFYAGFSYYTLFNNDEITINQPLSTQVYSWEDLEDATYLKDSPEDMFPSGIQLQFNDGTIVEVFEERIRYSKIIYHVKRVGLNPTP
ncbi:hypothetical protein ACLIA0_04980 [Bacillaceae bacterium W0354]